MKKILLFLIPFLLTFTGCEEPVDISNLKISISPDTLYITDADSYKDFFITVQPKYEVEYQITQYPQWLSIDTALLRKDINGGINPIRVTPLKEGLEGVYSGSISIISDLAGVAELKVFMSVDGHPKIGSSVNSLDFGSESNSKIFVIKNTGTGILNWSPVNTVSWLTISPKGGYLVKGQSMTVTVNCSRSSLDMNTFTSEIGFESNAENEIDPIVVSMEVPRISAYTLSTKSLSYALNENTKSFYVKNTGNSTMSWSLDKADYLNSSVKEGTLTKGDSALITLTLNRSSLENGTHLSKVFVANDLGVKDSIAITVNHFEETKFALSTNLVDAEFSRVSNKIFYVTTSPSNTLVMLDPETNDISNVSLNKTPTSLAVNADGTKVLIGHNGMVTYVDVATMKIEKEYAILCDALDVILTSKGWGYIFPIRDQWEAVYGIDLSTGSQHNSSDWMIYAGTVGRLHPSEKYIYGADNGLSPSDIEKYDIQNGTASMIRDSPYHGDYSMGGNLWFSEDGNRIFTRGKTILRSSELASEDMYYNGSLAVTNPIQSLFHSQAADRLFVLTYTYSWSSTVADADLQVFDNSYLNYKGKYTLEKFVNNNQFYNAEGKFVFASEDGKSIYVLTKAVSTSGLLYDWALQRIESLL